MWPSAGVVVLAALVSMMSGEGEGLMQPVSTGLDQLVRAASATCDALPLELLLSWSSIPELEFYEYSEEGKRIYKLSKAHVLLRRRLPSELVVYIPGWWNTPTDESSQTIVKALLQKHHLILVLDTRVSFCRGYVGSASRVHGVAQKVFKFLKNIQTEGYPLSSVHMIGFSLGAHVAGVTGKLVWNRLSGKVGRITALDPARPCFTRPSEYRLDKHDAKFVQVIHTSAGVLGLESPLGHADVYVNGLLVSQPECRERAVSLECDHAQSWKLFSSSVTDSRSLLARKCKNWFELSSGQCSGNETVLGYTCNPKIRGMFLFRSQEVRTQMWVFNPFDIKTWFSR
ncbi:lipase member H-B-like [Danaus plexippus]|uniref:lipase member H-B-like n=1 Tax=Danaus plexippus TaxID=13037 RepID=UPI002AB06D5E|nr:lipase member H-B-like [Danaus plexippus]